MDANWTGLVDLYLGTLLNDVIFWHTEGLVQTWSKDRATIDEENKTVHCDGRTVAYDVQRTGGRRLARGTAAQQKQQQPSRCPRLAEAPVNVPSTHAEPLVMTHGNVPYHKDVGRPTGS